MRLAYIAGYVRSPFTLARKSALAGIRPDDLSWPSPAWSAVEQADAVAGAPFGVPRTGIFGLLDLVGFDLGAGYDVRAAA